MWGRKVCECGECVRRVREDEGEKRVGWWDGDCVGR